MSVRFFVPGLPVPQGSLRAFAHKATGKPTIVQSSRVLQWRDEIAHEARKHCTEPFTGPVLVEFVFWMPRPKSHFGTGRNADVRKQSAPLHHIARPDVDKLVRAAADALHGSLYVDDSQIVELRAAKTWAGQTAKPGVHIHVGEAGEWIGGES